MGTTGADTGTPPPGTAHCGCQRVCSQSDRAGSAEGPGGLSAASAWWGGRARALCSSGPWARGGAALAPPACPGGGSCGLQDTVPRGASTHLRPGVHGVAVPPLQVSPGCPVASLPGLCVVGSEEKWRRASPRDSAASQGRRT